MGLENKRQSLANYHHRAWYQQQTETHPESLRQRHIYLSWSYTLRGRLQIFHTSKGYKGAFRGRTRGDSISAVLTSLQLLGTSQKRAYICIQSPNFCNFCPVDTSRLPVERPVELTIVIPRDCIYLNIVKAASTVFGFQSA